MSSREKPLPLWETPLWGSLWVGLVRSKGEAQQRLS